MNNTIKSSAQSISIHKKILFTVVLLFFILLFLEGVSWIALKFLNPDLEKKTLPLWVMANLKETNFIQDRLLFWRVPSSSDRLHTNAFGLRGDDFSVPKEPDVFRIITLGDSCTWGFGVQPGQEYPKILQDLLNDTFIPVVFEVQNAGIPGFSSLQGLRYFESELVNYQPDLITLYFGRNDARFLNEEGGYAPDHEVPVASPVMYFIKTKLDGSSTFRLLKTIAMSLRKSSSSRTDLSRGHTLREGRKCRVESDEFEANYRSLISAAKSRKIQVIAITAPVFPSHIGNYNNLVRQICQNTKIDVLDAETEFAKHGGNEWLVDDCHPNRTGHEWIASELKRKILDLANRQTSPSE